MQNVHFISPYSSFFVIFGSDKHLQFSWHQCKWKCITENIQENWVFLSLIPTKQACITIVNPGVGACLHNLINLPYMNRSNKVKYFSEVVDIPSGKVSHFCWLWEEFPHFTFHLFCCHSEEPLHSVKKFPETFTGQRFLSFPSNLSWAEITLPRKPFPASGFSAKLIFSGQGFLCPGYLSFVSNLESRYSYDTQ